jgi:Uma2 family endonuclease
MSALANPFFTPEQYLELEDQAEYKSEYYSGQIFAMAGGSPEHSAIGANIVREVGNRLKRGSCQVFNSDLRVMVASTSLMTYPDVTVVCGEQQRHPLDRNSIVNPTVLFEVLPDSTAAYDRGPKFALYQRLESLQEYVLVSQDQARVETYLRQPDGQWLYSRVDGLESVVVLESLGCGLPLAEIYDRIAFVETEETGTTHLGEHNL